MDDHRAGKIVVELNGRLNKCGVISPRFDVGVKDIEPWTARLLPSRQVYLSVSLSIQHISSYEFALVFEVNVLNSMKHWHEALSR